MSDQVNIYCDESTHLLNTPENFMVLGAVTCPASSANEINQKLRALKIKHFGKRPELKWKSVSPSFIDYYKEVISLFNELDQLEFRCITADKRTLKHHDFSQSHNDFYYKLYYYLLEAKLVPTKSYNVYLDIKDSLSYQKSAELHDILANSIRDFKKEVIVKVQNVRSHEIEIVQLCDLLIGAVQYSLNAPTGGSSAKRDLIAHIEKAFSLKLADNTLRGAAKMDIFHWKSSRGN